MHKYNKLILFFRASFMRFVVFIVILGSAAAGYGYDGGYRGDQNHGGSGYGRTNVYNNGYYGNSGGYNRPHYASPAYAGQEPESVAETVGEYQPTYHHQSTEDESVPAPQPTYHHQSTEVESVPAPQPSMYVLPVPGVSPSESYIHTINSYVSPVNSYLRPQ